MQIELGAHRDPQLVCGSHEQLQLQLQVEVCLTVDPRPQRTSSVVGKASYLSSLSKHSQQVSPYLEPLWQSQLHGIPHHPKVEVREPTGVAFLQIPKQSGSQAKKQKLEWKSLQGQQVLLAEQLQGPSSLPPPRSNALAVQLPREQHTG